MKVEIYKNYKLVKICTKDIDYSKPNKSIIFKIICFLYIYKLFGQSRPL